MNKTFLYTCAISLFSIAFIVLTLSHSSSIGGHATGIGHIIRDGKYYMQHEIADTGYANNPLYEDEKEVTKEQYYLNLWFWKNMNIATVLGIVAALGSILIACIQRKVGKVFLGIGNLLLLSFMVVLVDLGLI